MSFIETMLVSALIFWAWARVCEVWLNVLTKSKRLRKTEREE